MSNSSSVVKNIAESCEKLREVKIGNVMLESADPSLLDVSQSSLDAHVVIQPSAIAYYGSLKKEAARRLSLLRRQYERWQTKRHAIAKASLFSGSGKSTVADVEARYLVDNEKDIDKWEEKIDIAQEEFDTLDSWFEAWRQKSFSIREHAEIDHEENFDSARLPVDSLRSESEERNLQPETKLSRMRGIIREKKDAALVS